MSEGALPGSAAPRPSTAPRLDGIDLLRGAACLLVIFYHVGLYWLGALYSGWQPLLAASKLTLLAREGLHGVSLFLVLSGFCLVHPVARRGALPSFGSFIWQRAVRILPPYHLSLALLVLAVSSGGYLAWAMFPPLEAWDVAVHALLLHNLHARTIWSLNGAYWSLALEWQLYLLFPLLCPLLLRAPWRALLGCAVISVAAPPLLERALYKNPAEVGWWGVAWEGVPGHLFEFACGGVAAKLFADNRLPPRWLLTLLSLLWLPAAWLVDVEKALPVAAQRLACGVSFAALALLVGPLSVGRSLVGRAVLLPGVVSYSLYLLHQPLLLLARPFLYRAQLSQPSIWALATFAFVPASILLAWLFYRAAEAPFLRGGAARRFLDALRG